MSKVAQSINDRCPLQSECERKRCDYQFREKECSYYIGNARPGAEIVDQTTALDAEQEAEILASLSEDASGTELPPGQITEMPVGPSGLMMPLPIDKLIPHPDNPRKDLGDLTELADSIKANGIFQNLTVVPVDETYETFTVVIGHRRLAAAKLAGLKEVPCVIASMDAKEQVRTMLLENMQRSDLTVYEQAQGFQMMLDMGDSVEEIAAKSGFSKATVRRRVKMLELDQGTLKAVSERQLSLTDFDELAKIEDPKARNACLAEIGTSNFKQSVAEQVRQQTLKKKLPKVKKILKAAKAKALKQSDTWNGKYDSIGTSIRIIDWDETSPIIPENASGQLYYYLGEAYGDLRFYQEHKRPAPVKRPKAEIEKEKKIAETWNQLEEKAAVAYNLRAAFVRELSWNKKTAETVLRGALVAGVLKVIDYMSSNRADMKKVLGLVDDEKAYDDTRGAGALSALQELDVKQIPNLIYTMFADTTTEDCAGGYKGAYPKYQPSGKLNGLYAWLLSLGYQMSDEEKALLDGTHELYHRQEAEEKEKALDEKKDRKKGGCLVRRLYPLTPEEQEFAAIHIDLVDTFLRRERLDPNEYYDIVIFGYLEAVQKQHREPIEEERQNFNALAKICMRHAVGEDWKYRLKEKRKGDLLSLSLDHLDTCTENDEFSFLDFIPDTQTDIEMQVINLDLIERLLAVATPREREAIDLVCQGYETREVAELLGIARLTSSVTLHHFRVKAKAVLAGQEAFVPRCQRPKQTPEEKAAKDKARRKTYQEAHPEEMRAKWREQGARKRARAREKKLAEAQLQCEMQEKHRPRCSEHQGRQVAVAV